MTTLEIVLLVLNGLLAASIFGKEFFLAYSRKKGENFATKEDIGQITEIAESIRHDFAMRSQKDSQEHQRIRDHEARIHELRLAAPEKRLQAYQQAFTHWRDLRQKFLNPQEIMDVVMRCQEWWTNNCLYLDGETRDAFYQAYAAAAAINERHGEEKDEEGKRLFRENRNAILALGNIINRNVGLPRLSERVDGPFVLERSPES